MNDHLSVLIEQAGADIAELTRGLKAGVISTSVWQSEMADTLATYHTAAYMLAADVSDIDAKTRQALEGTIGGQLERLDAFAGEIDPSDWSTGYDARAGMYGDALKGSWWRGSVGEDLPCYPGSCEECYGNCRCSIDMRDDGAYWQCAADDKSCSACVERGNTWAPYGGEE